MNVHSESEKIKGGLRLDSRQGWITGGDSGKAIEPGAPEKSLLLEAIAYSNPDLEMPPRGKLPTSKIAQIEHWIRMGAADPRDGDVSESADEAIDLDKGRQFWSFRPISLPPAPKNTDKDWAFNLIDRFVMAELEKNSMAPTRDASKAELLRRVSFDLTGLPPSPDQIRSFQKDASEQHYQSIIDQMLGIPIIWREMGTSLA